MPAYKYHTDIDSPTHSGKRPGPPTSITLHWWGDPDHFSDAADVEEPADVARYLSRDGGDSSCHYVLTAGHVWCIVDPDLVAWHAGNWTGNLQSIGIEVDPDLQVGTYETLAQLVVDLWRVYGRLPLVRHRDWKATQCPGPLDVARVLARANELWRAPAPSKPTRPVKPTKPKPPASKPDVRELQAAVRAVRDNVWGPDTDRRLTAVRYAARLHESAFPYGVQYAQVVVGALPDGVWGPASGDCHDATVKRVQRALGVTVDGVWGEKTDAAYLEIRKAAIG
jgi:hypothetical protein